MPAIACTDRLLRTLGNLRRHVRRPFGRGAPRAQLGDWAATLISADGRDLVLAIEQRTGLTVAFSAMRIETFTKELASALRIALADLHIQHGDILVEIAAVEGAHVERLRDVAMRRELRDVEFICHVEIGERENCRRIQLHLNRVPRARRHPCVPIEAVGRLLSSGHRGQGAASQERED